MTRDDVLEVVRGHDLVVVFAFDVDALQGQDPDADVGQSMIWFPKELKPVVGQRNMAKDLAAALVENPDLLDWFDAAVHVARQERDRPGRAIGP